MKNKTIGMKLKKRNNEGKNKERKEISLDSLLKQRSILLKQFETGNYEDLYHAYDILDDLKHIESLINKMGAPVLL